MKKSDKSWFQSIQGEIFVVALLVANVLFMFWCLNYTDSDDEYLNLHGLEAHAFPHFFVNENEDTRR